MTNTAGRTMMKQTLVILIMVCMAAAVSLITADSIHAAATSPSAAPTIKLGQRVTGSFTKDQTVVEHYYKFRTGSNAAATYTLKGEGLSEKRDYPVKVMILDSNYKLVVPEKSSYYLYLDAGDADSTTFDRLKTNADYYVVVENYWVAGYSHKYAFTVTSSSNGGTTQTPSLVTPTLKVDKTRIVSADEDNVYVTGTVSYAVGQNLAVFDANGKIPYNYIQLGNSYGKESFRIKVPKRVLSEKTFTIVAMPVRNIINASNAVKITVTIGSEQAEKSGQVGYFAIGTTIGGSQYELIGASELGGPKATLIKAKRAGAVTIPATIKNAGKVYQVKGIKAGAFKGSQVTKVTVKTKKLTKASVKNSLKGSKVKTIKVQVGSKTLNKKYVKIYKKHFSKANSGKKIKVK